MKLRAALTPQDYVNAQYLSMRPRPFFKWCGIFLIALTVLMCVVSLFIFPLHWSAFFIALVGVYLMVCYAFLLPHHARKIFNQQKTLQQPYDMEITAEGVSSSGSHGSINMEWKDFHKYKMGKDLILVYQSDVLFHMFPKRWFSDDEFAQLQNYLHENLGEPKT
jgi:hypothetical protein